MLQISKAHKDYPEDRDGYGLSIKSIVWECTDSTDYSDQVRYALEVQGADLFGSALEQVTVLASAKARVLKDNAGTDKDEWQYQETGNPAWWALELLRGCSNDAGKTLYGGMLDDKDIDIPAFVRFAAFCYAQRLEVGTVITEGKSIEEAVTEILSAGRGWLLYYKGLVSVGWIEESMPTMAVFTPENTVKGSFQINYPQVVFPTEVIASFADKDNDYSASEVRVAVTGERAESLPPLEVSVSNIHTRTQVEKAIRYVLSGKKNQDKTYHWSSDYTGLSLAPGDKVKVQYSYGWEKAGLVESVSASDGRITLDDTPGTKDEPATITILAGDDMIVVDQDKVSGKVIDVPVADAERISSGYAWFARGNTLKEVEVILVEVDRQNIFEVSFSGVEYRAEYFKDGDYGGAGDFEVNYRKVVLPSFSAGPSKLSGLHVQEQVTVVKGELVKSLLLSWDAYSHADYYQVEVEVDGKVHKAEEKNTAYRFNTERGIHHITVYAVTPDGQSLESQITHYATFTVDPPDAVAGVTYAFTHSRVRISWEACGAVGYLGTEVRWGKTDDVAQAGGVLVTDADSVLLAPLETTTLHIWLAHTTVYGNGISTHTEVPIRAPIEPVISEATPAASMVTLVWEDARTDFPIKEYVITTDEGVRRYGADTRTALIRWKSSGGNKDIAIQAIDVTGLASPIAHKSVEVFVPTDVTTALSNDLREMWDFVSDGSYAYGPWDHNPGSSLLTWGGVVQAQGSKTLEQLKDTRFIQLCTSQSLVREKTQDYQLAKPLSGVAVSVGGDLEFAPVQFKVVDTDKTFTLEAGQAVALKELSGKYSVTTTVKGFSQTNRWELRFDMRELTEYATLYVNAADEDGTLYTPRKPFRDIISVTATPASKSEMSSVQCVIEDHDAVRRVYVLAYDRNFKRVSGNVAMIIGGF